MTGNIILFFLSVGLIPYAMAAVTPSWRWLLGVTLVVGGLLAALWIQDWIVTSRPDYHEGVGGALGRAFASVVTVGFATGVVIRALTLFLATKGLRLRHVIAIGVAGFSIVPSVFVVPALWHAWVMRPPSAACANATFRIKVANAEFVIPAINMINVYLGESSRHDAYYLDHNPGQRDFCGLSDNGRQQVKATNLWWRLERPMGGFPSICNDPIADWAKTYCDAQKATRLGKQDTIDFPLDIYVFAADEVRFGEFLGSRSTYEDSLYATSRPNGPIFFKSDVATASAPLIFECTETGSGYWCKTFYAWRDGVTLGYSFRSTRDGVVTRGDRLDAETRKFLSGFQPDR